METLRQLRGETRDIVSEWRRGSPQGTGIGPSQARAVVSALLYGLEVGGTVARELPAALFDHLPDLQIDIDQLTRLRSILHRRLVASLPPEAVVGADERLHDLVDQLLGAATNRLVNDLQQAALLDPLTGAGNRRALERDAGRELANAQRQERPVAVLAIDLDGLKRVNDDEGHAAGDALLRAVVRALEAQLRAGDAVYRVGGDEFVVLLPGTDVAGVANFVERSTDDAPPFSFGVACAPDDGWVLWALVETADQRLLDARRTRRVDEPSSSPRER